MPKSYSGDLRERVIEVVEAEGASRREAAERFDISVSSAIKWLQRWRENRSAAPKPRGGSVSPLEAHAERILALVAERPDLTLKEALVELLKRRIRTSKSALSRFFTLQPCKTPPPSPATSGAHIREWRQRRRMTQLGLALDAEISARHLSFLETGKAQPSREMVLHLCERLDVPLRERNILLIAAGYAPVFAQRRLDDPALKPALTAVEQLLGGHDPYPALAIDRAWTMVSANRAVASLLAGLPASLLKPPLNVLRLSLHPEGLAPRIANLPEWRAHLLHRLRHQIEVTADPGLETLMKELRGYPTPISRAPAAPDKFGGVVVPLQLVTEAGKLSFLSTTTVFGTPVDVTVSELAIESFFPADDATVRALQKIVPR